MYLVRKEMAPTTNVEICRNYTFAMEGGGAK